ncbi:hypothetical protein MMC16_001610 [Acarospora aff. strigata]|nr:hypothetical protein [Acarospora aff. strigata]
MLPLLVFLLLATFQRIHAIREATLQSRQTAPIPDFVKTYAPLVYLDQNEVYLPSDLQAQLDNTFAASNVSAATNGSSPLLLSNLDQLNGIADCTVNSIDACAIFLTSKDNITSNSQWLYGVLPDPITHETRGAKTCAIIVNDHGNGVVDAFYMYFYAFNLGNTVNGQVLGNHVGDWEHTMVRFINERPTAVWFSQHENGQAFTYSALSKNGTRPIVYSALGTHANFAVPGTHSRTIATVIVNDTTSAGRLWDPILAAYYYAYTVTPSVNGGFNFTPAETSTPISYLTFLGRWGDARYPTTDPRQVDFLNLHVAFEYESGPTGPLDKSLNRTEVCPDNSRGCTTLSALPGSSGSSVPVTVSRASSSRSVTGTSTELGAPARETSSATTSPTGTASTAVSGAGGARPLSRMGLFVVKSVLVAVAVL